MRHDVRTKSDSGGNEIRETATRVKLANYVFPTSCPPFSPTSFLVVTAARPFASLPRRIFVSASDKSLSPSRQSLSPVLRSCDSSYRGGKPDPLTV